MKIPEQPLADILAKPWIDDYTPVQLLAKRAQTGIGWLTESDPDGLTILQKGGFGVKEIDGDLFIYSGMVLKAAKRVGQLMEKEGFVIHIRSPEKEYRANETVWKA